MMQNVRKSIGFHKLIERNVAYSSGMMIFSEYAINYLSKESPVVFHKSNLEVRKDMRQLLKNR